MMTQSASEVQRWLSSVHDVVQDQNMPTLEKSLKRKRSDSTQSLDIQQRPVPREGEQAIISVEAVPVHDLLPEVNALPTQIFCPHSLVLTPFREPQSSSLPASYTACGDIIHQPLTKRNLRCLDGIRSSQVTSSTTSSHGSQESQRLSALPTIMRFSKMFKDEKGYDYYPELKDQVDAIVNRKREVVMTKSQERELSDLQLRCRFDTDTIYLVHFMNKLLADKALIQITDFAEPWVERVWTTEKLRVSWLTPFRREMLPPVRDTYEWVTERHPQFKHPMPNLLFGLDPGAFTTVEQKTNSDLIDCVQACPESVHPWFIVQSTSSRLCISIEHLTCSAGAALVSARRRFNSNAADPVVREKEANEKSTPEVGPDLHSIVFSLNIDGSYAEINVHWAEVLGNRDIHFHMSFVNAFGLKVVSSERNKMKNSLSDLRCAVENILDWGTKQRKYEIQDVIKKIQEKTVETGPEEPHHKTPVENGGELPEEDLGNDCGGPSA